MLLSVTFIGSAVCVILMGCATAIYFMIHPDETRVGGLTFVILGLGGVLLCLAMLVEHTLHIVLVGGVMVMCLLIIALGGGIIYVSDVERKN